MKNKLSGFTLFEILLCTTILAVLLTLALPALTGFINKNVTNNLARQFHHALKLARSTAITRNTIVTFCKSDNGLQCQGQWQQGGIVFVDHNVNATVDASDEIIYRINSLNSTSQIYWRAFQNKQYIQMTPQGFTNYHNGNFTFCPPDNDIHLAQQLVINRNGRVRIAVDTDQNGIKEDSSGADLHC